MQIYDSQGEERVAPALDPFLAKKLHLIDGLHATDLANPEAMRRVVAFLQDPEEWQMPKITVRDGAVSGRHGEIRIRIYEPAMPTVRALLWVHGGGFVAGNLDMPEARIVAAELADRTASTVVTVAYSVARAGVRYPVPVDDVHDVWLWMLQAGIGHHQTMAMGGASTGATLALSTALRLRDRPAPGPRNLLLAYPVAHFPIPESDPDIVDAMSTLPPMLRTPPEMVASMVRRYVGPGRPIPVDALPGTTDLRQLPPTHIVLSELDDVRSSGELLIAELRGAGVPVQRHLAVGMPHGHLNRNPSLQRVEESLDFLAHGLIAHL